LLSFGAECFVFQFFIQKCKYEDIQNCRFHVVLYGCETWSLTLREECRLRVVKKRVLRRIFGPKRDEIAEEWRGIHNEELYAQYFTPNIIRVIKSRRQVGRACSTYGEEKRCIQGFGGET
jgi:hypothetical protein